jgi:protein SCO1/2
LSVAILLAISFGSAPVATRCAPPTPDCVGTLEHVDLSAQLTCLQRLRAAPDDALHSLASVESLLAHSDGATDDLLVAAALDVIRGLGPRAQSAGATLSALLSYRAAIYHDRDKLISSRLRAYVFATLSDIGVPEAAEPALLDALAHVDERMVPLEVGAAARAVGTLGARGDAFKDYLVSVLSTRISEEEFTLAHFESRFTPDQSTTIQIEALRALGRIADRDDAQARNVLRGFAQLPESSGADPRAIAAAKRAENLVGNRTAWPAGTTRTTTPWIAATNRVAAPRLDVPMTDHDGHAHSLKDLLDRPSVVVFFYTRCQNDAKCSMTMSHLAFLQRQLVREGIEERVRLIAITYEPQFDAPARLNRFATDRGLELGAQAVMVQVDPARQQQVIDELLAPVSYNTAWVSAHGVECSLLDAHGRLVRKYSTVTWDDDDVVADLKRLLAESR